MKIAAAVLMAALVVAMPGFAAPARKAPPPPSPERAARAFYAAYLKIHPSGIPSARERSRLRELVSDRLYALLEQGERAEQRYAVATRHESPPLVEWDIFSSLFEGLTAFSLGACMVQDETMASCIANLTYSSPGEADTRWSDTVLLVKVGRRYRVDDIAFGGTWAFANKGRSSEIVTDAISESQKPAN